MRLALSSTTRIFVLTTRRVYSLTDAGNIEDHLYRDLNMKYIWMFGDVPNVRYEGLSIFLKKARINENSSLSFDVTADEFAEDLGESDWPGFDFTDLDESSHIGSDHREDVNLQPLPSLPSFFSSEEQPFFSDQETKVILDEMNGVIDDMFPRPSTSPKSPSVSPMQINGKRKTAAPQPTQPAIVDINNATIDQLLLLPGVSRGGAEMIIKERKLRRGFKNVEDVADVLSLQPHQAEQLKKAAKITPLIGLKPTSSALKRVLDI